jgi:hypothetical protein
MLEAFGFELRPWVRKTVAAIHIHHGFHSCRCHGCTVDEHDDQHVTEIAQPRSSPTLASCPHVAPIVVVEVGAPHSSPELDRTVDLSTTASRFYSPGVLDTSTNMSTSNVHPPTRRLFSLSQKNQQPRDLQDPKTWAIMYKRKELKGQLKKVVTVDDLSQQEAVGWCFENVMNELHGNFDCKEQLRKSNHRHLVQSNKKKIESFSSLQSGSTTPNISGWYDLQDSQSENEATPTGRVGCDNLVVHRAVVARRLS